MRLDSARLDFDGRRYASGGGRWPRWVVRLSWAVWSRTLERCTYLDWQAGRDRRKDSRRSLLSHALDSARALQLRARFAALE